MSITVMRKVAFCAGHRLLNHGLLNHDEVDDLGRVVDFADIKRLFKGWIDDHWDHGTILWDADENALAAVEQIRPNKIYRLPYNPTAENDRFQGRRLGNRQRVCGSHR